MRAVLRRQSGIWFGWSGSVAPDAPGPAREVHHGGLSYVVTDLLQEDYEEYYNGFANRVLWPILHYRLDLAEFLRRDLTGYMPVNEHFPSELPKVINPQCLILGRDYQLTPPPRT